MPATALGGALLVVAAAIVGWLFSRRRKPGQIDWESGE
jgi:uncharacterized protein (TIGR03382 family)